MWRKHPAGKQRSPLAARLGFLGEEEPQYELKTRLAQSFRGLPNVRAAYLLTQALLPALKASQGQIVFINSTVGLAARANVAQRCGAWNDTFNSRSFRNVPRSMYGAMLPALNDP